MEQKNIITSNWVLWAIGASLIVLVIIIIVGISVGIAVIKSSFHFSPSTPVVTKAPEITIKPASSKLASDSAVIKLKDDLKTIRQSVDSVDLMEPQINTPALDLNINIKYNPQ